MNQAMRLRHYGNDRYVPEMHTPVSNFQFPVPFKKPAGGGLWTSPIGSARSWLDWCNRHNFGMTDVYFDVEYEGRTLVLNKPQDLSLMKWWSFAGFWFPDFEDAAKWYDAIWLTSEGLEPCSYSKPFNLSGWDCETVLVLNPQSIKPL